MTAEATTVELGDYLRVIRRRYVVVAIAVLFCMALALGYSVTRPAVYRSTAHIALAAPIGPQSQQAIIVDIQTELAVVRSEVVAARAAAAIPGDEETRKLLTRVTALAPTEARVITVSYAAADPQAAQVGAQAFADAYIAQKREERQASIDQQAETFRTRIATIEEGIAAQEEILDGAEPASREARRADNALTRLTSQLSDLTESLTSVESQVVDGGTIITPARLPQDQQPRGTARTLAAALAGGLLLGLAVAFLLDRLDTRVRGSADLERALGVRSLGSIPVFPERYRRPGAALVTVHAPGGPEADAFRRLRTAVQLASRANRVRTLGITSSVANEGKTTVAANLAVALAQGGRRVLLVAADVRRPGVEELFDLPVTPGFTDVLLAHSTVDDVVRRVGDLSVITRGSPVDSPTDLLGSPTTARALAELAELYDQVIVDTPPVLAVADALALAPMLDAMIVVVSTTLASTAQVAEVGAELSMAGGRVIGAAMNNDVDSSRRSQGY